MDSPGPHLVWISVPSGLLRALDHARGAFWPCSGGAWRFSSHWQDVRRCGGQGGSSPPRPAAGDECPTQPPSWRSCSVGLLPLFSRWSAAGGWGAAAAPPQDTRLRRPEGSDAPARRGEGARRDCSRAQRALPCQHSGARGGLNGAGRPLAPPAPPPSRPCRTTRPGSLRAAPWLGWGDGGAGRDGVRGRAAERAQPTELRPPPPFLSLARAYAAPQRPWDPGSSECPPELSSPACRPSGKREGSGEREGDFPALLPAPCEAARARPRPSLQASGSGEKEGEKEGGRVLPSPPGQLAGRGGRRRRGRGPHAVKPQLGDRTPGRGAPRPPCPEEGRRVSFPALKPKPGLLSTLSLPVFSCPCGSA